MPKAYKVVKRTIMFDKENPRNVYTVAPDYHPRSAGVSVRIKHRDTEGTKGFILKRIYRALFLIVILNAVKKQCSAKPICKHPVIHTDQNPSCSLCLCV